MLDTTKQSAAPSLRSFPPRWRPGPALAALAVALAGTLILALLQGERPLYGDSGGYWALAESFTQNGHFSLLNFDPELRGYALPLVIYGLKVFNEATHWSPSVLATLFNVVLFALIGSVLAPRFAEVAWPQRRWGIRRRIALTALLLVYWCGDLSYPLTDFPGAAMALLTLAAIARTDSPGWMLIAGIAGGLAINLRPAFLPLLPMLGVIVALAWFDQRGTQHASFAWRALCVGLLVAGFAGVSLPQSLVTHRFYGSWDFIPAAPANLGVQKLAEGLTYQRFDSYVKHIPPAALRYADATGQRLRAQQPGGTITSSSQYVELVAEHPTVMIPLLARHLINGVDTRYNTIYVEHIDSGGRAWMRLTGFLLFYLALMRLLWPAARRRLGPIRWRYLIGLSLCCLTSVATAVETRFMVPLYVLSYILVLMPGWPNPLGPAAAGLRRFQTPVVLAITCLGFMAVVWHVASGVHGELIVP